MPLPCTARKHTAANDRKILAYLRRRRTPASVREVMTATGLEYKTVADLLDHGPSCTRYVRHCRVGRYAYSLREEKP